MILTLYNWFRIKSKCDFFVELKDYKNIINHIKLAKEKKLKIFILGDGSNVLLNEDLRNYYVIKPVFDFIKLEDELISVGSGCSLDKLINYCIDNNLIGIENFSGIPGNIGGCVFMNIHYKKHFISDYIFDVFVFKISTEEFKILKKEELCFSYRDNLFKRYNDYVILSVRFLFYRNIDNLDLSKKRSEIISIRNNRYPSSNTCGCFFYNIPEFNGINKSIGYQIERLKLNNIFEKNVKLWKNHKNMFVTNNNCSSSEIIKLANKISLKLIENINYKPITECRLIGFKNNKLEFSLI